MVKFVSDTRDARETPVIVAVVLAALFFGCAMTVLVYSVPFFIWLCFDIGLMNSITNIWLKIMEHYSNHTYNRLAYFRD